MRHKRKHIIFTLTLSFALLFFNSSNCFGQIKPWTLRGCMRYLDRHTNDTIKYDFKVSPYNYCYFKHGFGMGFRNGMGLWRLNPLTMHFRLRGIWHADDMSSIIKKSFYRYLNNEPIKFREQKKKYQEYWEQAKKDANLSDVCYELWGQFEPSDSVRRLEYMKLFYEGRKVLGYFEVIKKTETSSYIGMNINYIGEVISQFNDTISIKILSRDNIKDGFVFSQEPFPNYTKYVNINDTIEINSCDVYLIPDE